MRLVGGLTVPACELAELVGRPKGPLDKVTFMGSRMIELDLGFSEGRVGATLATSFERASISASTELEGSQQVGFELVAGFTAADLSFVVAAKASLEADRRLSVS